MVSVRQVREVLRGVMDPELDVNIVDLGLIYKIHITAGKVKILMTLTTPGCPLAGMFDALVRNALKKIPGLDAHKDVDIELTFDPPWVPDMMTEELRVNLGL